jgi:hypothetical protein
MELLSFVPENLGEVLRQIIKFSKLRRRLLHQNIEGCNTAGYVPRDLPVDEFAEALNGALAEHVLHRRLLFRDTANIQFGKKGVMRLRPIVDGTAMRLLHTDRNAYLELQIRRLLENALNRTIAEELTGRKNHGDRTGVDVALDWEVAAGGSADESDPRDAET